MLTVKLIRVFMRTLPKKFGNVTLVGKCHISAISRFVCSKMFKRTLPAILSSLKPVKFSARPLSTSTQKWGIYEPDYLESLKPKFPQYNCLNFQIKGFDYPVLESYQKWLHSVAEYLDLDVSDCYALPPKHLKVQKFKPASAVIDAEYKMTIYERHIQIADLDAPIYPFLLRLAQAGLPEGVTLEVSEHTSELEEARYVPDKDLLELKAQLDVLQGNAPAKKK